MKKIVLFLVFSLLVGCDGIKVASNEERINYDMKRFCAYTAVQIPTQSQMEYVVLGKDGSVWYVENYLDLSGIRNMLLIKPGDNGELQPCQNIEKSK